MIDLKCKLTNCEYNKNSNCMANEISVSKTAECKSFKPVASKKPQSDKIPMPLINHSVDVNCCAECIMKKNGKCIANGITVVDETGKRSAADCSTFMPK